MRLFRRPIPPKIRLVPPAPTEEQRLLAAIYLYIDWRYVTKKLTTEQKNILADAIDAVRRYEYFMDDEEYNPVDRWWEN